MPYLLRSRQGMAVTAVLLVLFVLSIATFVVTRFGSPDPTQADDRDTTMARYAAEAGVHETAAQLLSDPEFHSGFVNKPLSSDAQATYTVQLANNFAGKKAIVASDATRVPVGMVYALSSGTCGMQTSQVGCMMAVSYRHLDAQDTAVNLVIKAWKRK